MKPFEDSLGSSPTLTGALAKATATLVAGTVLGNYRIVRLLGAGGMGAVYLAEHIQLQTRHALKTIRPEFAKQQNFAERFQREAKLATRLKHPHIVACTETGVANGTPYLVMDYIEGPAGEPLNLRQLLDQRRERGELLDEDEAAAVGLEICKALDYAHSYRDAEIPNGIIHRDLKPANILLDKDTKLYIADFGLARLLGEKFEESVQAYALSKSLGEQATLGKQVSVSADTVGTFDYMSPEQREGRTADARSDVFAMGVILYELLTGRKVVGVPAPPGVVRPGLSSKWEEIILERALAYEPGERFATAGDFCRAIEGVPLKPVATPPPLEAKPVPPPPPQPPAPKQEEPVAPPPPPETPPQPDSEQAQESVVEKFGEPDPRTTAKVMAVITVLVVAGLAWVISKWPSSPTGAQPNWATRMATSSIPVSVNTPTPQPLVTNPVIAPPVTSTAPDLESLRRGLVLYFSFDNIQGDQVLDDSGLGSHGTRKSTTVTSGIAGSALDFFNDDAVVTVPNHPSLNLEKALTLSAWVRGGPNQSKGYPRIIDKFIWTGQQGYALKILTESGRGRLALFPTGDQSYRVFNADSLNEALLDDQWRHLTGTFDGSELRCYVDGVLSGTTYCESQIVTADKELTIGNGFDGAAWLPFKGSIDEVAIFNRALSGDEVKQLHDLGKRGQSLSKPGAPPTRDPATSLQPAVPSSPAVTMPPEIQDLFTPAVTSLPADERLTRVLAKMRELNPAFRGNVKSNQVKSGLKKIAFEKGAVITNLWPLRSLAATLTELHCRSKSLEDLTPLKGMQLTHLDCADSQVSDLSPLRSMKSLRTINCCGTRIHDLSPLEGLPLRWLGMNGTRVADLTPLTGMPLEFLGFPRTAVTDLSVLKTLPKLRKVKCDFKADRDAGILRSIKTLEEINGMPVKEFWTHVNAGESPQAKPDEDDRI